jgi:2-polyprenyl-6-methoxyphenol hydroxylase-like FAD-dependent oxidoreductase
MAHNELPLGQSSTTQALIIGAGMAGLLAARMLSNCYAQVLIFETDTSSTAHEPRPGAPQAFHIHRLLPRGKWILEYIEELLEAEVYPTQDKRVVLVNPSGIFQSFQPDQGVPCSKALLDWEIRQRVQALPNVRILSHQEVIGLGLSAEDGKAIGIIVRKRGQLEQQMVVSADLVIDASGRTSQLTRWLQDVGYDVPEEDRVNALIGYSTRYYMASSQVIDQAGTIVVDEVQSEGKYEVGILPIEDGSMWETLFGIGGHYPATDGQGFDQGLSNLYLIHAQLADQSQQATPQTAPRGYHVPACVCRHYGQASRWPGGLLALGDAFCHFDSIYGRGMSVTAIEAETLSTPLQAQRKHPHADCERQTLRRMKEAIASAWWLSVISDLCGANGTYEGPGKPHGVSLIHRYLDCYFTYSLEHPVGLAQALQTDQPNLVKFVLLNELTLPPVVIFHAPMFNLLLDAEAASDGPHILQKLVDDYQLSSEEILEQIVPLFPSTSPVFVSMSQSE